MINIDSKELQRLNRNLADYATIRTNLTKAEILDKKGNDARIHLWEYYFDEKYGGKGRGSKSKFGIAFYALAQRTKTGKGTLVRQKRLDSRWGPPPLSKAGKELNSQQALVWQETTRRQTGVGLLGVSFLSKRFRSKKNADGTVTKYLAKNISKTLGDLVTIQQDESSYTITGETPGLGTVDAKYGILNRVVNFLNVDIEKYNHRKWNEAWNKAFSLN